MPLSPRSPVAERVSFPSSDAGVTLEGRLALKLRQDKDRGASGAGATVASGRPRPPSDLALVLLHPHAALGGSMADPVCSAIYREAKKHERFGAVAKFNARGVGGSGGGGVLSAASRLSSLLWSRGSVAAQGAGDAAAVVEAVSSGRGIAMEGEEASFFFGGGGEEGEDENDDETDDRRDGSSRASSSSAPSTGYPRISRTYVVGYSWGSCLGAAAVSRIVSCSSSDESDAAAAAAGGSKSAAASSEKTTDAKLKAKKKKKNATKIGGFVAVSPPLGAAASLFLGSGSAFTSSLSSAAALPALVAIGDRDQFCSEGSARSRVEGVNRARREKRRSGKEEKEATTTVKGPFSLSFEPVRLEVSPGLDHFWGAEDDPWSREEIGKLARRVVAFILETEERLYR